MTKYEIKLDKVGWKSTILRDGVDIGRELMGFDVRCRADEVTTVTLYTIADEVTGVVEVEDA